MSGDMVSEQISIPVSRGHVEAVSGNPDKAEMTNMMETSTNDHPIQHMPVSDMQSELTASASSSLTSQHVDTSNVLMGVSDPMSFSFVPQFFSCQPFSLIDSQTSVPELQPSVVHQYPSGGSTAAFSSSGYTQLTGKRKSPLESVPNGSASAPQKLDVSNKRVSQIQHRPWLQQLSPSSNGSVHFPTFSLSATMQHVPKLSKQAVQTESVSSTAAKQLASKKLPVPSQASKKMQSEGNESVRSKMRESLAAALALAQQEDDCIAGEKSSHAPKDVDNFATTHANSESVEPVTAAVIGTPAVVVTTSVLSSGDENSGQKDSAGRILLHETSDDTQMKDANQSYDQKSEFDEVFPQDDVPFSASIFANDELLQGNGLSWVLEPVSDLGEAEDVETDAAPRSGDESNERTDGEKSFQDPELLASEIEMELFNLFGGVNKKYKEKGRSLLFNLKDKNNPELRKRVMYGEIPPARLCSMTAEELASKELSQWRQAKAEEMAEMVVLRDTDIDVRQLVRKTHKGEFQVEIDPVDSGAVDVSASVSSHSSQPRPKTKGKESSHPVKSLKKDDSQNKIAEGNQGKSCTITIPSNEGGTDPMQGLSMDDEMKDVGFLPPIVSLDEFMESLNSEPPFESPQEDAGKEASVHKKSDSESVSSHQSPKEPSERDSPKSKPDKANLVSPKSNASVSSNDDASKPENNVVTSIKGEKVWDGILQLSTSSVVSVTGIYKSGERAQTREWPTLVEVKGRVRVSAFAKFLKELPLSRSRALMVMYLVCKDGISESQRGNLYEAAESYVADERVGYSEPTSGMELYLCPPRGQTLDMIGKIISNDQLDEFKRLDVGLIGVVVWRRAVASSPRPRDKPGFKRHHSSSGSGKSSVINAMKSGRAVASSMVGSHGVTANDDGNDDDVPPGFGPGSAARDEDDDLPEFNFDSSSRPVSSPRPQSRSMHQVRELIHKYGKSVTGGSKQGIHPWNNNNDEDDDDIPEWQPRTPSHHPVPPPTSLQPPPGFGAEMDPRQVHSRTVVRPPIHTQQPLPPPPRSGDGWWANQNTVAEQPFGHARPRNRGF